MTPKAFHALFGRIGAPAKLQFPIHPHILRHGCGYALADAGHDTRALQAWLGHKNIQRTRCVTPNLRRIDLRTSGAENVSSRCRLEPAPYGLNRNACDPVRASPMIAVRPSLSGSWEDAPPKRGFKAMHGDGDAHHDLPDSGS
jgi:Phage integrase family